jgi:hypothetical protein
MYDGNPPTLRVACLQPNCRYTPAAQPLSVNQSSNLWKHYHQRHPHIALAAKSDREPSVTPSSSNSMSSFFEPRAPQLKLAVHSANSTKYRDLLLNFIVFNNLPLSLVESLSFRQMVQHLSPSTLSISARTLHRDLHRQFSYHRAILVSELQRHILNGGRISITTDSWSARNYHDFSAVTVHWINDKWQQKSNLLDVIHLKEPIHSGEYLASQLLSVTDEAAITRAIFTCTRDNASANTVMLAEYEKAGYKLASSLQQPWTFTVKEGDVRCIAHIINLAVQDALKVLKADPNADTDSYRVEQGCARIPIAYGPNTDITTVLAKLRRHIYVFRNRRGWRDALQKQTTIASIKVQQLSLDMPVRWNSTFQMLSTALALRVPITALCASQTLDLSMRDISLTQDDWSILIQLKSFFQIFVKPSMKLQASSYPTLNMAIPYYMKMINKLQAKRTESGYSSTIGEACQAAIHKLDDYYTLATSQRSSHSNVATICDPRLNL